MAPGGTLVVEFYYSRSTAFRPLDAIQGARRAPGPTSKRARGTKNKPTSFPAHSASYAYACSAGTGDCFIHQGRPRPMGKLLREQKKEAMRHAAA